ncbi:MAG: hypothetical protein RR646_06580 [Erysipelotrichaceae bacterium]
MKIYNKEALTTKERFQNAIIASSLVAIACIAIGSYIMAQFRISSTISSLLYLLIAFLISETIKKTGHGVQAKFSYLSVTMFIVTVLSMELISTIGLTNILNFGVYARAFSYIFQAMFGSLIGVVLKAVALYYSYINSKII